MHVIGTVPFAAVAALIAWLDGQCCRSWGPSAFVGNPALRSARPCVHPSLFRLDRDGKERSYTGNKAKPSGTRRVQELLIYPSAPAHGTMSEATRAICGAERATAACVV